jgi:CubicO group peptidase (beta-lactamase class C family)
LQRKTNRFRRVVPETIPEEYGLGARSRAARIAAGGFVALAAFLAFAAAGEPYFPGPGTSWEKRDPRQAGFDPVRLKEAVDFALANEVRWERDVRKQIEKDVAHEPYPAVLGEAKERGGPAGMILRHGYVVAQWGDVERVDMSFSVAKSYLSIVAGLAFDAGLLRDVHEPVAKYVRDGGVEGVHNGLVTWHMLLNQTSEWQGTLWDKPDVADRRKGYDRELHKPGTFWEYNDVRVNRLALALLQVWRRPLPEVLKEKVMDPIGASDTWQWQGYRNSWTEIDGKRMWSVSGGSHWGGGFWASTADHARFGLLLLRRGQWNGTRLISERWLDLATTPTAEAPHYGYLFWLAQQGHGVAPGAPNGSFFALGSGGNVIWVVPDLDLVVVTRWLDFAVLDPFIRKTLAAVSPAG